MSFARANRMVPQVGTPTCADPRRSAQVRVRTCRTIRRTAEVLALALIAGCAKPHAVAPPPLYTGPTDPLDVVLLKINANNGRIATLVGAGDFEARIVDAGKENYVRGQLTLLHTKPASIRIDATKDVVDLFKLGANADQYWFSAFVNVDTTWFGSVAGAAESSAGLPIAPTLIADVLGVATLDTDLLAQPVPMMRFNPDYDAYMLTWSKPSGDRWIVLREVWYDRATLEPRRVWLFDRNGRVVLRARLSGFAPFDGAAADGPRVARGFDLFFPASGSRLTFTLDEVRPTRNGAPNRLSYRFNPETVSTAKKVDLDAAPGGPR